MLCEVYAGILKIKFLTRQRFGFSNDGPEPTVMHGGVSHSCDML